MSTWREHVEESEEEMIKTIIAVYEYRDIMKQYEEKGKNFKKHFYIPSVDTITQARLFEPML